MNRDLKGNILSVVNYYKYNQLDEKIEVSNELKIPDKNELLKIINFDFEELIESNNLNNNQNLSSDLLIISKSDFEELQDKIINLEEQLISTSNFYESEIDLIKLENTVLLKTIETINSGALSVTNYLLNKYNKTSSIYNDLLSYKTLWSIPYNDLILKTGSLLNLTRSFNDYSMSVIINYNNYPPTISNVNFINNIIVSYSFAYDSNYLLNLFKNSSNNLLLLSKIEELTEQINKLKNENTNLWKLVLEEGIYQFNENEYSDLLLNVYFATTSSFNYYSGFYINIKNLSNKNLFEYNFGPFNPSINNLNFETVLRLPPGKIKVSFLINPIIIQTNIPVVSSGISMKNDGGIGNNTNPVYINVYNNGIITEYNNLNGFNLLIYPFKQIDIIGSESIDKINVKLY